LGRGEGDSCGVEVGVSVGVGDGDGLGVGVGVGETFFRLGWGVSSSSPLGAGVIFALRLLFVLDEALGLGDGVGLFFLRFGRRWLGVGVGVAKNFLIFSPNDGSSAGASGAGKRRNQPSRATESALVRLIRRGLTPWERRIERKLALLRAPSQFLQDGLVHLDPGFEILERKILVRRMRPAIGQGEAEEESLHSQDVAEL